MHPEFGNNMQFAEIMGILDLKTIIIDKLPLLNIGRLPHSMTGEALAEMLMQKLNHSPLHVPGIKTEIETIAWCTGAAQDFIEHAITSGVDAFVTGEVSERTVHIAREAGIHFFAAGHHATERYGVAALGEHLAKKFDLQHEYIEIPNPV